MSAFETAWSILKELTPTQLRSAAYGIDPTLGRVGHATKKPDPGEMTSRHITSGHLGEAMQPRGVFDPETSESFDMNPISQSKRVLGYGSDYKPSASAGADQERATAEMHDPHEMQPRIGRTGGRKGPEPERGWSPQNIGDYLRVARKRPPSTTESQKTRVLSREEIELLGRQAAMRRP